MEEYYMGKAVCVKEDCRLKETCIRLRLYRELPSNNVTMNIINPRLATGDETCTMYIHTAQVKVCYGFLGLMKRKLSQQDAAWLRDVLMDEFGKNPYYERRNGKRPISPQEQQYIQDLLTQRGLNIPKPFDKLVDEERTVNVHGKVMDW